MAHTMQMTPDDWDRAKEIFEAALELDPSLIASIIGHAKSGSWAKMSPVYNATEDRYGNNFN